MDQLSEGAKNVHEVEKARKRLEVEKDELQLTLEEAERALENQEAKIVFTQLELSGARQEIESRLHEKEEEFEELTPDGKFYEIDAFLKEFAPSLDFTTFPREDKIHYIQNVT